MEIENDFDLAEDIYIIMCLVTVIVNVIVRFIL